MVRRVAVEHSGMHLPDGLLSARVAAGSAIVAALGLGLACGRVRRARDRSNTPLLGVSAAFVFAAQLVNFPVAAGTSGHLVGGALCAALVGLPAAVVVMSAVLIVQCMVFGDGGVLALGANVINMALVGCIVGYCVYRLACGNRPSATRRVASVAFAAFCSVVAGSASCAEELALSGTTLFSVVLPAMILVHVLVGIGEAVITALVVASVLRLRPELLERSLPTAVESERGTVRYGLGFALIVVALLAPLASPSPDGLTRVAAGLGLYPRQARALAAPLAGYTLPGLGGGGGALTLVLAGGLGTLVVFGACWLLALALVPRARGSVSAAIPAPANGVAESSS